MNYTLAKTFYASLLLVQLKVKSTRVPLFFFAYHLVASILNQNLVAAHLWNTMLCVPSAEYPVFLNSVRNTRIAAAKQYDL